MKFENITKYRHESARKGKTRKLWRSKHRKCVAIENAAGVGKFRFFPSKTWPRLANFECIYTKNINKK